MISIKELLPKFDLTVTAGEKIPHSTLQPVIHEENGKYVLAAFAFFYTRDDMKSGVFDRPSVWVACNLETGEDFIRYDCRERDFSDAPYEKKYDLHPDKTYDTTREYYSKAYKILDAVRQQYIEQNTINYALYKDYLSRIVANIPGDYKRFFYDMSIHLEEGEKEKVETKDATKEEAPVTEFGATEAVGSGNSEAEAVKPEEGEAARKEKTSDTAPKAQTVDLTPVLEKLEQLQQSFDTKIKTDKVQNARFDNMHRELVKYQNGAVDKRVDDMAMEIIMIGDNIDRSVRNFKKREPTEENYQRLLKRLGDVSMEIQDLLYAHGYETFSVSGHNVDVRKQKIISTVETDDESKNNKVAARTAIGYSKDEQVFRKENIKVYKYKKPDGAKTE